MKEQLNNLGYVQNYFPFNETELELLKSIAEDASGLSVNDRKKIFGSFPLARELFEKAIADSGFHLTLTDYCFFIEKTDAKNWPLLFHKDINLPDYLGIPSDAKETFLENAVMFRLTLDTSDKHTGALKVIPGSHKGKINEEVFVDTKEGEVIFFRPLLLHGSNKMKTPHTRRVFQALCLEV